MCVEWMSPAQRDKQAIVEMEIFLMLLLGKVKFVIVPTLGMGKVLT